MSVAAPRTLALETSTTLGSLALGEGSDLAAECTLGVRAVHSESVLPEAERLLSRCGWSPGDLDRVVVGAGPGSFTGVRIAASIARGLCYGTGRELFAYSSLAAVAAGCAAGDPGLGAGSVDGPGGERREARGVCALRIARRDEVYAAAISGFRPLRYALEPSVLPLDELLERLEPEAWVFAGAGARNHRDRIRRVGGWVLPGFRGVPRGAALLWLAETDPRTGRVEDVRSWEPTYLRRPGARPPSARSR